MPLLMTVWQLSLVFLNCKLVFLAAIAGQCLAAISRLLDCKVLFLQPLLGNYTLLPQL